MGAITSRLAMKASRHGAFLKADTARGSPGLRSRPWGAPTATLWGGASAHTRTQPWRGSNIAIDSTCAVCGNMSITPAARSFHPHSLTR
jgi:hypothetical protein